MMLDIRKRILGIHLIVLVLSAAVSAGTYYLGSEVVGATRALVDHDVPGLQLIAAVKHNILELERILYEYYATQDREKFQQEFHHSSSTCRASLHSLLKTQAIGTNPDALAAEYDRISTLATQLDTALRDKSPDSAPQHGAFRARSRAGARRACPAAPVRASKRR